MNTIFENGLLKVVILNPDKIAVYPSGLTGSGSLLLNISRLSHEGALKELFEPFDGEGSLIDNGGLSLYVDGHKSECSLLAGTVKDGNRYTTTVGFSLIDHDDLNNGPMIAREYANWSLLGAHDLAKVLSALEPDGGCCVVFKRQ